MAKFSLILFSLGIFISVTKIASYEGWWGCPDLILENGKVGIKDGGRVNKFECTDDWIEVAGWSLRCVKQRGNTPVPSCIRHGCPSLTPPRHGGLDYYKSVVKVFCDPGYTLTKSYYTIACDSGVWNASVPACKEWWSGCRNLILENGKVGIKDGGRVSEIECRDDWIEFDGRPLQCVKQQGNTPLPPCVRRGCPSLTPLRHGGLAYHYNKRVVKVICDPGYIVTKSYDTLACDSGVWNATLPACKEWWLECPDLILENGKVGIKDGGRVNKFECTDDWIEVAGWSLRCVKQRGNTPLPSCVMRGCPSLTPPRHGGLAYHYNKRWVSVFCDPGYTLTKNYDTLACDLGVWNALVPACKASYASPDMACTFEGETCGWTNSPDNHFLWELKSAALLHLFDQNNSPVTDHTLGTTTGQFMTASAGPEGASDGEGRRATLYSPVFKAAHGEVACFNFFYHIYGGRDTGELRVYFKPQDTSIEFLAPDFQTSSPSRASWVRERLVFTNVTQPFQIVIESKGGIVVIDDVMINYDVLCVIPTCTP